MASELAVIGRELAPLVAGYCAQLAAVQNAEGGAQVLFLAREGVFLAEAYKRLGYSEGVVLDVSRQATFAASFGGDWRAALPVLDELYPYQSPAAFCRSLNLPEALLTEMFTDAGFKPERSVHKLGEQIRHSSLMATPLFCQAMDSHFKTQYDRFLRYWVTHLGALPSSGKTFLIADVGWKGTIQNNLARLFPEVRMVGVYCALSARKEGESKKLAYVADVSKCGADARFLAQVLPFELLFNAREGSVVSYDKDGRPIRKQVLGEQEVFARFTGPVQHACLAELARHYPCGAAQQEALRLREPARNQWLRILENPPMALVYAAYQLTHNDNFGAGVEIQFRLDWTWANLVRAMATEEGRARLRATMSRMPWPRQVLGLRNATIATKVALVLCRLSNRGGR